MKNLLLLAVLLFSVKSIAKTKVYPIDNNLGGQVVTNEVPSEVKITKGGDLYFYYENGYCVKFRNIKKLVCNKGD